MVFTGAPCISLHSSSKEPLPLNGDMSRDVTSNVHDQTADCNGCRVMTSEPMCRGCWHPHGRHSNSCVTLVAGTAHNACCCPPHVHRIPNISLAAALYSRPMKNRFCSTVRMSWPRVWGYPGPNGLCGQYDKLPVCIADVVRPWLVSGPYQRSCPGLQSFSQAVPLLNLCRRLWCTWV